MLSSAVARPGRCGVVFGLPRRLWAWRSSRWSARWSRRPVRTTCTCATRSECSARACLNARDRNCSVSDVACSPRPPMAFDQFLFVYGERPSLGEPRWRPDRAVNDSRGPSVRRVAQQGRQVLADRGNDGPRALASVKAGNRLLVRAGPLSLAELVDWRASIVFAGPLFASVEEVPSASMACKPTTEIPRLAAPKG